MELRRSKNVATYIVVPIVDADGDVVTGAAGLDSELNYWEDGSAPQATFSDCTNEASEIGSTGIYSLSLTQAEMNHDYVYVTIKTTTSGAKAQHVLINCKAQPSDVTAISGDATAADNCELMFDGTGYAGGTTKLDVNAVTIEGSDATNQIRDAVVDDATRIDASALNTLSGHDPGEAIMGATDIGTGSGLSAVPWNAAWDAEVQSECTDALNAYDPPTKAELDTAQGAVTLANGPHGGAAATLALGGVGGLTGAITGNVSGSVGSVSGAVGSVAAGGITAASIATDAIDNDAIAATAVTEIQSGLATSAEITALNDLDAAGVRTAVGLSSANLDTQLGDLPTNSELATALAGADDAVLAAIPSAASVADAVWDEALAGHAGVGSAGAALAGAGSAGDPWSTALPGAYGSGTAGKILGDNLNAAVSSRASQTSVDTVDDLLDTEVAAILAIANKLDTALELDGAVYRFTTNALEQAPSGGGSLTAQQVWEYATRALTDKAGFTLHADYDAAKTAASQTSVNDLPTNSELATALGTADDAVLSAVAALHDFDPATDVVAHVTLVDTTTTNTDMVAAAPAASAVADAVWDEAIAGHAGAGSTGATLAAASAPSAASVADAVWDEALAGHAGVGSAGAALAGAGSAGDPWSTPIPGAYGAGTAGAILGTTIPSAIDAVDNYVDSEVTALTNELAKVPKSDGTASWNSTALAAIQGECTDALEAYDPPTKAELDAADDAVLAAVAALNDFDPTSDVVAHVTLVDTTTTNTDMVDVSGITVDNAAIADAVWDEALNGHADVGSSGAALTAAGVAGDPWTAELPGSYAAGTAGAVLPALDAAVSALGAGDVTVVSPVAAGGTITIEQSDSYPSALGRAITVAIADATHALALDGADCDVYLRGTQFTWTAASVTSTTTGWTVTWTPTIAQTTPLTLTKQAYKIIACYDNTAPTADDAVTIARGTAVLKKDIPAVS